MTQVSFFRHRPCFLRHGFLVAWNSPCNAARLPVSRPQGWHCLFLPTLGSCVHNTSTRGSSCLFVLFLKILGMERIISCLRTWKGCLPHSVSSLSSVTLPQRLLGCILSYTSFSPRAESLQPEGGFSSSQPTLCPYLIN